jgi:hypothetical protein
MPDERSLGFRSHPQEFTRLADEIELQEDKVGHARTILVGDLNAHPFDPGVVSGYCLNATLSRQVASRGSRVVQQRQRRFFFNPMWTKYNDGRSAAPASTFYREPGPIAYYWQMVDQLLIRPPLMSAFDEDDLQIVTTIGGRSLLRNGRPDKELASDHLPLVFSLELI